MSEEVKKLQGEKLAEYEHRLYGGEKLKLPERVRLERHRDLLRESIKRHTK